MSDAIPPPVKTGGFLAASPMTSEDHINVKRKLSPVHGTEMDFFVCPQCGKEAIVLW